MNQQDIENMSPEELSKLQSMISVAQSKRKLGEKYRIHHAIEETEKFIILPEKYLGILKKLENMEEADIIPSIMDNDTILRFPLLVAMTGYFPCSDVQVRCGLIELFDSYVYHSDFGLIVSNLAPFDVDKVLRMCSSRDPNTAVSALESFYQKLIGLLNNPISEGESRTWIRQCMNDIKFISQIAMHDNLAHWFDAAISFMRPASMCDMNNEKEHAKFVETFLENGSDLIYARRIASCFKLN